MIYRHCALCGDPVYRYVSDSPRAGEMGNALQDCWHTHYSRDAVDHFPIWPTDDDETTAPTHRVTDDRGRATLTTTTGAAKWIEQLSGADWESVRADLASGPISFQVGAVVVAPLPIGR